MSIPLATYTFTVEFFLSDALDNKPQYIETEEDKDKAEWFKSLKNFLTSGTGTVKEKWESALSKSISKIPISHPDGQSVPYRMPGYAKQLPGRYTRSGSINVTFNDNVEREIRFILESLMNADGFDYSNNQPELIPILPKVLYFDMRVRVYSVELVNLYDDTEGNDPVSEHGTVQSYYYSGCFISKLADETNTYEASENVRTIEATITYRQMDPE